MDHHACHTNLCTNDKWSVWSNEPPNAAFSVVLLTAWYIGYIISHACCFLLVCWHSVALDNVPFKFHDGLLLNSSTFHCISFAFPFNISANFCISYRVFIIFGLISNSLLFCIFSLHCNWCWPVLLQSTVHLNNMALYVLHFGNCLLDAGWKWPVNLYN